MQAQGSEAKIIVAKETTFKTVPEQVIFACEAAFSELVDADVTASLDAADYKKGSGSAKLVAVAGLGAGDIMATEDITSISLALYTHVVMWIKSDIDLDAGDLQLLLDNSASCASPLETLDIPAIEANTWTAVAMALSAPASDTAIISVGIKQVVDVGAFTLNVDDIRAVVRGKVIPFVSEGVALDRPLLSSKTLRSSRNPVEPVRGNKAISGPLSTELQAYIERMLYYTFGAVATVAGAGMYTHTFTIGSLPSFVYEKGFRDIDQYFLYSGCKVSKMDVNVPQEGLISCNFDIMGAKEAVSTATYDGDPIDDAFSPFDAFGGEIQQGGSAIAIVTAVNFSLDNSLDGGNYAIDRTNPGERVSLPARKVAVKGTLTAFFENATLYNLALNNTETTLSVDFERGTGAGTAGNEKLTFSFEEIKLQPKSPAISGDEGIKIELAFEAYYSDGASASALVATLLNAEGTV